jgi:tetratricopeptide (TPR) repeat protein
MGYALTMLGRACEARAILEQAAVAARATGDVPLQGWVALYRARAVAAAGDATDAGAAADQAVELAESIGAPVLLVLALTVAGRVRLRDGRADEALQRSLRAMALRDELGGIEEDEAEVFLVHAQALAAAGRRAEAREVQARGRERLWTIAGRIGDLEWRARFLRDVPAHRALVETEEL